MNDSKLNGSQANEFRKFILRNRCAKEFEFPLLWIPQNVKSKNCKRLVFEQEKGPVVQ